MATPDEHVAPEPGNPRKGTNRATADRAIRRAVRQAAEAALRGQITPRQIEKLARKQARRSRTRQVAGAIAVAGVVAGGAYALWKWWDKQTNPDWLVEPPAAAEASDSGRLMSIDGTMGEQSDLDPEVTAKQAESESADGAADRDDEL